MPARLALVVFDLDGTLIDSKKDLADAANAMVRDLGGRPLEDDEVAGMVGEGARVLVERALAAGGVHPQPADALDRFLGHYDARLVRHTRPYPGVDDLLARTARRVPVAVLSNKPERATRRVLAELGLDRHIRACVGGDGLFPRKPDPAGLLHLTTVFAVTPETTLLVGDSPIDRETARRAGTRLCLVRYGFGFRGVEDEPRDGEFVVDTPADAGALIDRLLA